VDGRTGEGTRSSAAVPGSSPRVGRGGVAEPLRNETFESMLFSSHWRSSMRTSLLRPAVPLMDLHFLRRDGVAAIQESGTRTSGLNNDTKSSVCLHTQWPKQTRQLQLSGIAHVVQTTSLQYQQPLSSPDADSLHALAPMPQRTAINGVRHTRSCLMPGAGLLPQMQISVETFMTGQFLQSR
jgi:hypothetical protein